MTNINWDLIGALAGVAAVLLVVILEYEKLLPRIGGIASALIFLGACLFFLTLFVIVSLGILLTVAPNVFNETNLPISYGLFAVLIRMFMFGGCCVGFWYIQRGLSEKPSPDLLDIFAGIVMSVVFAILFYLAIRNFPLKVVPS